MSEYIGLVDGRRVILHTDRGFTLGIVGGGAISDGETASSITEDVLNTVLPDDDNSGESHPWEWLAELATERGIAVTAAELRVLPYTVILTDEVRQWVGETTGGP